MHEHTQPSETVRQPQYIDEAEVLIGPFFTNQEAENALLYQGIEHVDPEHIDARYGIYVGALRIVAEQRRQARKQASYKDVKKWNQLYDNSLTEQTLESFKLGHGHELEALMDRLAKVNHQRPPLEEVEDITSGLYEHQKPYMRRVAAFLKSKPTHRVFLPTEGGHDREPRFVKGAVVEGGTGIGKSAIMGRTAVAAGIGSPMASGARNHRALIVTPSKLLNDQLAGIVGDDTFRRFAPPGIKVISYSGEDTKDPDADADVVVTTIEQFVKATKQGLFYGQEFDLLLIDEAHQITEPQFKETYIREWRVATRNGVVPLPAIGFTARTAYSETKDAAKILPEVIRHRSLTYYMEKDILTAGQFYTLVVDPTYEALDSEGQQVTGEDSLEVANAAIVKNEALLTAAYDMAVSLIHQGRKGIIFCEAGDKSAQARELADMINSKPVADDRPFRAEALYAWDPKTSRRTRKIIQAFNDGEIDVLTTVGVGQQGLNADFHFVGICGAVNSVQKMTQEMGRGMRKSKTHPTTVFFHILMRNEGKATNTVTFGDVIDRDIQQGQVVGPKPASGRTSRVRKDNMQQLDESELPPKVRLALDTVKTHSSQEIEYVLNGKMPIPADYVQFETIYKQVSHALDRASAKRRLDRAGYTWRGKLEKEDDMKILRRYYEPAAESFFTEKPVPARASDAMKTANATAQHLGISEVYLEKLRDYMEQHTPYRRVLRLNKRNVASFHYTEDSITWLEGEVAKIPREQEDDQTALDLSTELDADSSAIKRIASKLPEHKYEYKRRKDGKGFAWFYDSKSAAEIKRIYRSVPWANDEWSFVKIAQNAGVKTKNVYTHLTPEESAAICVRRTKMNNDISRALDHLPPHMAKAVVDRIINRRLGLPAHLMPYAIVTETTNAPKKDIPNIVEDAERNYHSGNNYMTRSVGWEGLRRIIEKYSWRKDTYDIDFEKLPKSADDKNVERLVYARAVQLRFMTAEYMGNPDGIID